ncbi:uroporphyrinogen decarboxylase [Candidatus Magnetominusculus xianensis]|uniref:Uroporphyrinogen decarboxylase n=1 Tax=Candidatus Magnetominusculus xianensis TaxID=1748249 RepID=A0ABR5SD07_9BACT|nr:uroporphyrinogen decarboxylase [Candidatus Magnetominusculus xianensis]KWT82593.1 uroporphyrinogen decarboxylase [Candidatus Magnetominusculus xianensis]MBF0405169.1 uroporphyrinogen decarboxylase [Nitrospirota bacterium]
MNNTFIYACAGMKTDYTPVWIMRQAGRYLPEYRKIRAKVDFLTLCKTPELAAEVTVQPVDILGVDAAILFSDILIPIEKMGLKLKFYEKKGPKFSNPVRTQKDADRLKIINPDEDVPYVLETIRILCRGLKVPLIGFSGAPFTAATYMIEGGSSKNFLETKRIIYNDPQLYQSLMEKIAETTIAYLSAQIKAGAQAVQLFDSWAGALSPSDYETAAFPYAKKVIEALKPLSVPIIYFVNDCAGILSIASEAGADVMGVDWRIDMSEAVIKTHRHTIQGNLDPCVLFSTKGHIKETALEILKKAKAARAHIFNLGHGILPETPPENVKTLVEIVHEASAI